MSEVTEFLVWRSALAETPDRLRRVAGVLGRQGAAIVEQMTARDAEAVSRLAALLGVEEPTAPPAGAADPVTAFAAGRERLLTLLTAVDASTLHRETRLADRRTLDPWRLAGELAEHDVQSLAALRRSGKNG